MVRWVERKKDQGTESKRPRVGGPREELMKSESRRSAKEMHDAEDRSTITRKRSGEKKPVG